MHNAFTLPSKTYVELDQPEIYQRFMKEYLDLLRKNFKQFKVVGQTGDLMDIRHSCGQEHNSRNPHWKPFQYLAQHCRKCGYDDMEARDVIEEQIGRRLECECQLLGG